MKTRLLIEVDTNEETCGQCQLKECPMSIPAEIGLGKWEMYRGDQCFLAQLEASILDNLSEVFRQAVVDGALTDDASYLSSLDAVKAEGK